MQIVGSWKMSVRRHGLATKICKTESRPADGGVLTSQEGVWLAGNFLL